MDAIAPEAPAQACPLHAHADGFAPYAHDGMYAFYARTRPDTAVFHAPEIVHWVVTRRADAMTLLKDSGRFSAVNATQPVNPWPQEALDYLAERRFSHMAIQVACDPPLHTRVRDCANKFLNIKRFHSYADEIRAMVRAHLDRIEGRETVDLVDALTYELPAQVVFLLLGERNFDPRKIKAWGDMRLNLIWGRPSREEVMTAVRDLADFWDYAADLVRKRKARPGDDYPSAMLALRDGDDPALSDAEVGSLVFGLLLAGHETTTNGTGNLLLELLRRPDQWRALAKDPSLIPGAVEEGLRFASPVVAWRRLAKEQVEVGGKTFPAGTKFLISLGSANRDDARFEDGETFDIRRRNARDHVAFGQGLHFCIGAPLARLEMKIILEELTGRYPDMALIEDAPIRFTETVSFRGPDRIMVRPLG